MNLSRQLAALKYSFLKTHAGQCLAAEDHGFIESYIGKLAGKNLPAASKEVFGPAGGNRYKSPPAVTIDPGEVGQIVADWRARCK